MSKPKKSVKSAKPAEYSLDITVVSDLDAFRILETMSETLSEINDCLTETMPRSDRRALLKMRALIYKAMHLVEDAHEIHGELYDKYWRK